ncbi:hypothetical protein HK102_003723 [Quaeritorhiza haematococci]|nr:hypothetical protein HK102_003723 [Quaeritorhiza haematococci]
MVLSNNPFDRVPNEISMNILVQIPFDDMVRICKTNKAWRQFCKDNEDEIFRRKFRNEFGPPPTHSLKQNYLLYWKKKHDSEFRNLLPWDRHVGERLAKYVERLIRSGDRKFLKFMLGLPEYQGLLPQLFFQHTSPFDGANPINPFVVIVNLLPKDLDSAFYQELLNAASRRSYTPVRFLSKLMSMFEANINFVPGSRTVFEEVLDQMRYIDPKKEVLLDQMLRLKPRLRSNQGRSLIRHVLDLTEPSAYQILSSGLDISMDDSIPHRDSPLEHALKYRGSERVLLKMIQLRPTLREAPNAISVALYSYWTENNLDGPPFSSLRVTERVLHALIDLYIDSGVDIVFQEKFWTRRDFPPSVVERLL